MYIPTKVLVSILNDDVKTAEEKVNEIQTILKTKKRPDKKELKQPTIKIEQRYIDIVF